MPNRICMTGNRYGRLVVLRDKDADGHLLGTPAARRVVAKCDCGEVRELNARAIRRGRVTSCGCAQREAATTHGMSAHPGYHVWQSMIGRCYRETSQSFAYYGARGIGVCGEWRESPVQFVEWLDSNGWRQGKHQIDRIDNDGGYSPSNCRLVSCRENQNNRRKNVWLETSKGAMTLTFACEAFMIGEDVVRQRLKKLGWSTEKALTHPVRKIKRRRVNGGQA